VAVAQRCDASVALEECTLCRQVDGLAYLLSNNDQHPGRFADRDGPCHKGDNLTETGQNIPQSYYSDVHMIQHPLKAPGRLLNGDANSSHADGESGGNMAVAQRPNRLPLPAIGPKLPPWEPLNGSFVKVPLWAVLASIAAVKDCPIA
jgi:hypothetical protein